MVSFALECAIVPEIHLFSVRRNKLMESNADTGKREIVSFEYRRVECEVPDQRVSLFKDPRKLVKSSKYVAVNNP